MRKKLFFLCLMVASISLSACSDEQGNNVQKVSDEQEPTMLKVSKSSDEMYRKNYQTAIAELEEVGFTNITTKVKEDVITGIRPKDGEVAKVVINGDSKFSANDSFEKDSKIVITYHTYAKEKKSDKKVADEKRSETSDKQTTNSSNANSKKEILTVENNEDFAAVLAVKNEADPIIGKFAKKYAGRTIEFDGYIANMMLHGNYKTRYNILILAGDYGETTFSGPNFQFEDVNIVSDLNLTGSNIPDTIGRGQNLHITAVVKEYNEASELFRLEPISTEIR
jgi:Domain of unknown function (DUF4839)